MSDRFLLERQRVSERPIGNASFSDKVSHEARHGGQFEWFWGVPGVFQALAAPLSGQRVPAAPDARDVHEQSLGYWAALHYLLIHRLGWGHPDRGLRWWYDEVKPVEDLTLSLISDVWDRDGNLDAYLGWLLKGRPVFLNAESPESAAWPADLEPLAPHWERWVREVQATAELTGSTYFQGGMGSSASDRSLGRRRCARPGFDYFRDFTP